jgi:UDP-N-acetylmuramate dehydrogenase
VFKNPPGELGAGRMLEECGLKGHRIGGATISPKHANFIENADGATTADCLALMVEARRRVREQFDVILEREVVLVGGIELPPLGG